MEPRQITWSEIGYTNDSQPDTLGLGRKQHGYPVRAYDGVILWVESYQWQILPDGSRELPRYRVVGRMDNATGTDVTEQPFPFDKPGMVMEFSSEQEARNLLVKRAHGRI